jgi:hypothetical protein
MTHDEAPRRGKPPFRRSDSVMNKGGPTMSMFENPEYRWRETCFVLFDPCNRPTGRAIEKKLAELSDRYVLKNLSTDDEGRFESLTLLSPDDFAALDVCYTEGEEVAEQTAEMVKELEPIARETGNLDAVKRIRQYDGRLDVLHFERVADLTEDEDEEELLDPSALLVVLGTLAQITGGVAVDPQSGAILSEEG